MKYFFIIFIFYCCSCCSAFGNERSRQSVIRKNTVPVIEVSRVSRNFDTKHINIDRTMKNRVLRNENIRNKVNALRTVSRSATKKQETKIGLEYQKCKSSYFDCMDQFCKMKNDEYKRCSCSNRISNFEDIKTVLNEAGDKLTVFNENLNSVSMTKNQASSMKTETEGENALTEDVSASKSLLQAIMNSIKGEEKNTVSGKYSKLNSVSLEESDNDLNDNDLISNYNGAELYKVVFQKCKNVVKGDCNTSTLQRSVTAYLMEIEKDCNTLQTVFDAKQKKMTNAVREGNAMLDLARVENRKKHNSDDLNMCVANVEKAILQEEVCGEKYKKCLDNGKYINTTNGEPIFGVADFNKLANVLSFDEKSKISKTSQKLREYESNKMFISNFENRVKKYANDALDKCRDDKDFVWQQYLDKALLEIYYLQQDKVQEVRNTCLKYVTECYKNKDITFDKIKSGLTKNGNLNVLPREMVLKQNLCEKYINSCDKMFASNDNNEGVVQEYIKTISDDNLKKTCENIVNNCFNNYGGDNYQNFYLRQSNLYTKNNPIFDWFSVFQVEAKPYDPNNPSSNNEKEIKNPPIVSPCFKKIYDEIKECKKFALDIFGGYIKVVYKTGSDEPAVSYIPYTIESSDKKDQIVLKIKNQNYGYIEPTRGIAWNIISKIYNILSLDCRTKKGSFINQNSIYQVYEEKYGVLGESGMCLISNKNKQENICPADYNSTYFTEFYGICSCDELNDNNQKFYSDNGQLKVCTLK